MAILTAAQAREYLPGITGTDQDSRIETLIARAEAAIARRLHFPPASAGGARSLESATYTHYVGRSPAVLRESATTLRLPVHPVTAITTIHDDTDWSYGASSLVASSDYVLDGEAGVVTLTPTADHGGWSTEQGAVRVVYVAGWTSDPGDIVQGVALLVQHWWRLRKDGGRQSVSEGGVSDSLRDETIPDVVAQLVDPYQLAGGYL